MALLEFHPQPQPPAVAKSRSVAVTVEQKILDVVIPRQEFDNWCWAAVADGIAQAYGDNPRSQCEIVSSVLAKRCCDPATPFAVCNVPHPLPPALGRNHRRTYDKPEHRTFAFIRKRIDAGFPIVARIDWRVRGAGHAVVIAGYRKVGSIIDLYIWDPRTGERSEVRFGHFVSYYEQRGYWDRSYETQRVVSVRKI